MIGRESNEIAVGHDSFLLPANGFEHMGESEQRARMVRLQFQHPLIGCDGIVGQGRGRQRRGQLVMRLDIFRLEPNGSLEAVDRLLRSGFAL